jgi:hypothetical protein
MKKTILLALLIVAGLEWATAVMAAELYVGQGLVPVRNYQPIQGLSLQMPGESALPVKRGEWQVRGDFAETSTILRETTPTVNALLKLNQLRSALDIRYGTPIENVEVGLEVASRYNHSGGIDGLITAVEHAVGRPAPLRDQLKHTGYVYLLQRNGQTLLNPPNHAYGLSDAVLHTKAQIVTEGTYAPAVSIRAALKVPIGDQSRGFGTGVADLGVGLALQKTLFNRVALYINANEILPTGHYLGLALRGYFTSVSGVELMATRKFSITGQFEYYQSPFGHTGVKLLDRGVTEAVLALGYRFTPNFLWQVYGVENLDFIRDSAADLTLGTVLTYRIPGR